MSVDIESIRIGSAVEFSDGNLVDTGIVTAIDYDEYEITLTTTAADGTPSSMTVSVDEPGLVEVSA